MCLHPIKADLFAIRGVPTEHPLPTKHMFDIGDVCYPVKPFKNTIIIVFLNFFEVFLKIFSAPE